MNFVQFSDENEKYNIEENIQPQQLNEQNKLHLQINEMQSTQKNDDCLSSKFDSRDLKPNNNSLQEKDNEAQNKKQLVQNSDRWNYLTLILLYAYQGMTIGFISGSIPIVLIQNGTQFKELGLLSFTIWPWSFQMITAPFFDTYYSEKFGKRKTYIVPLQIISGIIMLVASFSINEYVQTSNIFMLFMFGILLQYIYSIQDIAVNGWALTLLSPENVQSASTCQNIGQSLGYTTATTLYIWLNSPIFINSVFKTKLTKPILDPSTFLIIFACIVLTHTFYITFFKKECYLKQDRENKNQIQKLSNGQVCHQQQNQNTELNENHSILVTLKKLLGFLKNHNLKVLATFLLLQFITTAPIDRLSDLILLKEGLSREMVSSIGAVLIPIQFLASIFAQYLCRRKKEFTCLLFAVSLRFINNIFKYYITINYQHGINDSVTIYMMYIFNTIDTIGTTLQSVTSSAFAYRMCDHDVGGSFLTILNSLGNFGSSWSGSFVLLLVDYVSFNTQFYISIAVFIIFYSYFSKILIKFEKSDPQQWKLSNNKVQIDEQNKQASTT